MYVRQAIELRLLLLLLLFIFYILYSITTAHVQKLYRVSLQCKLTLIALITRTELARRTFSVSAPSVWNDLLENIRLCNTVPPFKKHLKTDYFSRAFMSP